MFKIGEFSKMTQVSSMERWDSVILVKERDI